MASSAPLAATSPTTRSVGSVSVPVLSVSTTSTEASDSTALSCWASTPRWAILNAETAAVRLMSRIRPSGTRLTSPAVSACTRSAALWSRSSTEISSPTASGIETTTSHSSRRSVPRSSGERGWRKARAVAVSLSARLSGPTAVASKSASPSTANEPDHTGCPGPRTTGSDSPVRLASSRVSPSALTTVPSATTWSPAVSFTRSPTTTSPSGTVWSVPSRTTTASGATSAASRSSARLERTSWKQPMTMFETRMPRNRASRQESKVTVSTPNTKRIALGIVSVLARTMLA